MDRQGITYFQLLPSVCARVLYGPIPTISLILPPHLEVSRKAVLVAKVVYTAGTLSQIGLNCFSGCLLHYLPCLRVDLEKNYGRIAGLFQSTDTYPFSFSGLFTVTNSVLGSKSGQSSVRKGEAGKPS